MKGHTLETQAALAEVSGSAPKMKKTARKKNSSKNGLSVKDHLSELNSNISIAKGLLATLSLRHQSVWIKKYETTHPEHLRILLQEVMEEIGSADSTLQQLSSSLSKKYAGICLL